MQRPPLVCVCVQPACSCCDAVCGLALSNTGEVTTGFGIISLTALREVLRDHTFVLVICACTCHLHARPAVAHGALSCLCVVFFCHHAVCRLPVCRTGLWCRRGASRCSQTWTCRKGSGWSLMRRSTSLWGFMGWSQSGSCTGASEKALGGIARSWWYVCIHFACNLYIHSAYTNSLNKGLHDCGVL